MMYLKLLGSSMVLFGVIRIIETAIASPIRKKFFHDNFSAKKNKLSSETTLEQSNNIIEFRQPNNIDDDDDNQEIDDIE